MMCHEYFAVELHQGTSLGGSRVRRKRLLSRGYEAVDPPPTGRLRVSERSRQKSQEPI